MTIKKNLETELDDRWRRKGGSHIKDRKYEPNVCSVCKGTGKVWNISMDRSIECTHCNGLGEV